MLPMGIANALAAKQAMAIADKEKMVPIRVFMKFRPKRFPNALLRRTNVNAKFAMIFRIYRNEQKYGSHVTEGRL
jgi:hypothetical protein